MKNNLDKKYYYSLFAKLHICKGEKFTRDGFYGRWCTLYDNVLDNLIEQNKLIDLEHLNKKTNLSKKEQSIIFKARENSKIVLSFIEDDFLRYPEKTRTLMIKYINLIKKNLEPIRLLADEIISHKMIINFDFISELSKKIENAKVKKWTFAKK